MNSRRICRWALVIGLAAFLVWAVFVGGCGSLQGSPTSIGISIPLP